MAGRKLRLQIQQSKENGECRTPRWYGQHAITTNDITGSVMKILITDSNDKQISITIGKNGGIRGVDGNEETGGACKAWIDSKNDQQGATASENSSELNKQCIKEELIEDEEPETESLNPFNEVAEIVSEGYNLESLEPEVEEEFHTVMENIKKEEPNLAGNFETVFINSAIIPECYDSPIPQEAQISQESSLPIFESDHYSAMQSLLCRLCAAQRKDMVYIFGYNEAYKNIIEKIENCLSILVRETDSLPNQVCRLCLEKLELCHKFRATVAEAEKQFIMLNEKALEESRRKEEDEEMYPFLGNEELETVKLTEGSRPALPAKKKEDKKDEVGEDIIFVGETVAADETEEYDMIKCRICGRFFGTPQSLHTHSQVHYSDNYYPCCMCESNFSSRVDGLRHSMNHVVRKTRQSRAATLKKQATIYNLPPLPKTTGDKSSNGKEKVAVERDKTGDRSLCVKEAGDNQTPMEQSDDQGSIKCRICGVYFSSRKSCYMHSVIHYSYNNYPCSMCDKTFTTRADSYAHSIQHTMRRMQQSKVAISEELLVPGQNEDEAMLSSEEGDNNQNSTEQDHGCDIIKCRICGLYFGTHKSCYVHSVTHHSENHYPCSMCDKIFTNRRDSHNHGIEHTIRNADQRKMWMYGKQTTRYNLRSIRKTVSNSSAINTEETAERDKTNDGMLGIEGVSNDRTSSEQNVNNRDMVKCRICGRYFGTARSCYTHSKIHATENHLPCSMCDKVFTNEKDSCDHSRQEHIEQRVHRQTAAMFKIQLAHQRAPSPLITVSNELLKSVENVADKNDGITCDEETVQNENSAEQSHCNDMIKCRICGMEFKNAEGCYLHSNVHVQKDYYPCTICSDEFVTEADAQKHNLEHTTSETNEKNKPLQICNLCGDKFLTKDEMEFHKIHHSRRRKTCYCSKCDKIFASESTLFSHMLNTHTDDKEYTCKVCGKEFRSDLELKVHKSAHGTLIPYKCCSCEKKFHTHIDLRLHKLHHCRSTANDKRYSCVHCGMTFLRRSSLTVHMKRHDGERRHSCQFCSRTYLTSQRKDEHEATHIIMRIFNCTICKKRFSDLDKLKAHQKTHLEGKSYCCTICDKAFKTSTLKKYHMRAVHSDDKRYMCDVCGKRFMRPSTMRIHKRSVH